MKSKSAPAADEKLASLSFMWDFNCQVGSPLADWFYSLEKAERKRIKSQIYKEEGLLDCHIEFPEALKRWKTNQAIDAILKKNKTKCSTRKK